MRTKPSVLQLWDAGENERQRSDDDSCLVAEEDPDHRTDQDEEAEEVLDPTNTESLGPPDCRDDGDAARDIERGQLPVSALEEGGDCRYCIEQSPEDEGDQVLTHPAFGNANAERHIHTDRQQGSGVVEGLVLHLTNQIEDQWCLPFGAQANISR